MRPSDLDLKIGNTATISCAFNGQPAPSVVWRKDGDIVTTDNERRKITSCATSSVLEIIMLDHEDEGVYSCYATNQLGSDSASMSLSLHGTYRNYIYVTEDFQGVNISQISQFLLKSNFMYKISRINASLHKSPLTTPTNILQSCSDPRNLRNFPPQKFSSVQYRSMHAKSTHYTLHIMVTLCEYVCALCVRIISQSIVSSSAPSSQQISNQ